MTTVLGFDSVDDVFEFLRKSNKAADDTVAGWQTRAKVGDYYASNHPELGITVYAEVLDPIPTLSPDADADERMEHEHEKAMWAVPGMRHNRFIRGYSVACTDGELGTAHVSSISAFLSKAEFERARELGWPTTLSELVKILDATTIGNLNI